MKKTFKLNKFQIVLIGFIIPFVLFGMFYLIMYDSDIENNYSKIFDEINNDSIVKKEIGYINFYGKSIIEELIRTENDTTEYVKMEVYAKDFKKGIVEYRINKSKPVWELDSVTVLKVWKRRK